MTSSSVHPTSLREHLSQQFLNASIQYQAKTTPFLSFKAKHISHEQQHITVRSSGHNHSYRTCSGDEVEIFLLEQNVCKFRYKKPNNLDKSLNCNFPTGQQL